MIYVWKCLPDPGLEFLKVSGDGCEFGDIRLPPTLWSCLEHRFTQRYQYLEQSVSTSNMINQYQSLDPVNSCRFHQLRHQKHCLEILDCDSIFRPQIGQWVSPTILCWRNRDLGFCRYERNKRVQQTPESVFPQLLLPLFTADAGQVPWPPWLVPVFGVPVKSWVSPYLGKNRG